MQSLNLLIWAVLFSSSSGADALCSLRGTCAYDDVSSVPLPCAIDEKPGPVNLEDYTELASICPELVAAHGNNFCCRAAEIELLSRTLKPKMKMLAGCPSCGHNFRQVWCHMYCSPFQFKFVSVETYGEESEDSDEPIIVRVHTFVSRAYAQGVYESCKNVVVNATGALAMDLMCGPWGAQNCTFKRMIEHWGLEFDASASVGMEPFHYDTFACNESLQNGAACHCSNCPASCPKSTGVTLTANSQSSLDAMGIRKLVFLVIMVSTFYWAV